jgi:short-subunit dehydrogenase
MNLDGCNALITGASAGIGRELARQLSERAASLVLVARRIDRLEEMRAELQQRNPNLQIQIRSVDLADEASFDAFCEWIERERIAVDFLINNAGLGDAGTVATSEPGRVREMILVNVLALTHLTRRLLPLLIAQNQSAILNVSSSAGFLPLPTTAIYAATKAYVTSFSEALRAELLGTGVTVTTLCPGPVHTEFAKVARRASSRETKGPQFAHVSVESVVREGLAGIEANRAIVIPGFVMKLAITLVRLTPMPILRFAWRFSRK